MDKWHTLYLLGLARAHLTERTHVHALAGVVRVVLRDARGARQRVPHHAPLRRAHPLQGLLVVPRALATQLVVAGALAFRRQRSHARVRPLAAAYRDVRLGPLQWDLLMAREFLGQLVVR